MPRTIPGHVDSLGKLLERLSLVAKEQIYRDGKQVTRTTDSSGEYDVEPPSTITLSPSLLRKFECVSGCTACCLPFTLDFTPEEFDTFDWTDEIVTQAIDQFSNRMVEINGVRREVLTYEQFRDPSCPYLRPTRPGGALGCGFWSQDNSTQPLECAAAPQLLMTTRGAGNTVMMKRPFGRGWAWQDKPQCYFEDVPVKVGEVPADFSLDNEIMLLERYGHWADHFGVETYIPAIIEGMRVYPGMVRDGHVRSYAIELN
jgi:hypothetical protein